MREGMQDLLKVWNHWPYTASCSHQNPEIERMINDWMMAAYRRFVYETGYDLNQILFRNKIRAAYDTGTRRQLLLASYLETWLRKTLNWRFRDKSCMINHQRNKPSNRWNLLLVTVSTLLNHPYRKTQNQQSHNSTADSMHNSGEKT